MGDAIPRRGAARSARLAMLPVGFAGRAVAGWGRSLAGADADEVAAGTAARNDEPIAAASLGQVYRAQWHDGRDVAVNVQYPGSDVALDADLRQLQRFAGLFGSLLPGLDARA